MGRGKLITDAERMRIVDLYEQGMSMREVGRSIGRSYGAVHRALHRCEVEVGPRWQPRRLAAAEVEDKDQGLAGTSS